jgi:hypothetical protein
MSNQKISKITLALRNLIKLYYKIYTKESLSNEEPSEGIIERFNYQLGIRTGLNENITASLLASIQAMLNNQLEAIADAYKDQQLSTNEKCKQLF